MQLICAKILNNPLKGAHPSGGKMAILQHNPSPLLRTLLDHLLRQRPLPLPQTNTRHGFLHLLTESRK